MIEDMSLAAKLEKGDEFLFIDAEHKCTRLRVEPDKSFCKGCFFDTERFCAAVNAACVHSTGVVKYVEVKVD